MIAADNRAGTVITCTNPDCGCRLTIERPCPHGSDYTCACGHPFEVATAATEQTQGSSTPT